MAAIAFEDLRNLYLFAKKPLQVAHNPQSLHVLVTGGAGFVGSHLVDRLMLLGHRVTVLDNFYTGNERNIQHWITHPSFTLITHDISLPFVLPDSLLPLHRIYHLASPASPPKYQLNPIITLKTAFLGTLHMLGLAKLTNARFLLASTSEVYGDPLEHPQPEEYNGNVTLHGPRSCYDEGKRVSETLTSSYKTHHNVATRIVRIFNTYGPRMDQHDGRVVSSFIVACLKKERMSVFGSGEQTRCFLFVVDLVIGLILAMESDNELVINIGSTTEITVNRLSRLVKDRCIHSGLLGDIKDDNRTEYLEGKEDDPKRRKPVIERARSILGWNAKYSLEEGLDETIEYFKHIVQQ